MSRSQQQLDTTLMATLLLPMTTDFRSLETLSWLGSSFLIAATVGIPLAGRLIDIFSRGAGVVLCNLVFTLGTFFVASVARMGPALRPRNGRTRRWPAADDLVLCAVRPSTHTAPRIHPKPQSRLHGRRRCVRRVLWRLGELAARLELAFLIQVPLQLLGTILVFFFVRISRKTTDMSSLRRIN